MGTQRVENNQHLSSREEEQRMGTQRVETEWHMFRKDGKRGMGTQRVKTERHLFSREEKRGMGTQRDNVQEGKKTTCTYTLTRSQNRPYGSVDARMFRGGREGPGKRRKGTGRIDAGTRARRTDRDHFVDDLYTAGKVKASQTVSFCFKSLSPKKKNKNKKVKNIWRPATWHGHFREIAQVFAPSDFDEHKLRTFATLWEHPPAAPPVMNPPVRLPNPSDFEPRSQSKEVARQGTG
jgi:hypothetical protein